MTYICLSPTPFQQPGEKPRVVVTAQHGPYANTRRALAQIDLSPARGKRVLLKPNAGRIAQAGSGIVTHPEVVAAALDAFLEAGAQKVAIGESPIVGVKALEAFGSMDVTAVAHQRQCQLIDLDMRPFVEVALPEGIAIHALRVCPEVLEYDIVVSIPVMKMHMHTGVTLAVKNMKGCLWRRSKVQLHMLPPVAGRSEKPIDIAIADMAWALRPHLAIIDGTVGMEGLGPSAGVPRPLDALVVSADAFAADAVACRLMGTRAETIPHLRIGAERGYGVMDPEQMDITPEHWETWMSPFAAPPTNLTLAFPNITILDQNSCSACQSTLMLFLKRYGERVFDYFPAGADIRIAIGKGHADVPVGTICIGNCTTALRGDTIFIPGCPPVASQILTTLSETPSVDSFDGHAEEPDRA